MKSGWNVPGRDMVQPEHWMHQSEPWRGQRRRYHRRPRNEQEDAHPTASTVASLRMDLSGISRLNHSIRKDSCPRVPRQVNHSSTRTFREVSVEPTITVTEVAKTFDPLMSNAQGKSVFGFRLFWKPDPFAREHVNQLLTRPLRFRRTTQIE